MSTRSFIEQERATNGYTLTFPHGAGTVDEISTGLPSYFPVRQSSMVNTFKQQQRINLVRKVFLELACSTPRADHWFQRAQTAPESYISTSRGSEESPTTTAVCRSGQRISLHTKSATVPRHAFMYSHHHPVAGHYYSTFSDPLISKPRWKQTQTTSVASTVDQNITVRAKKTVHYKSNQDQTHGEKNVQSDGTKSFDKNVNKSAKHHKKDHERDELNRERLEYYQQTYHIVNYYLNKETRPGCTVTTARDNTHLLELFTSTEAIPGVPRQAHKTHGTARLEKTKRLPGFFTDLRKDVDLSIHVTPISPSPQKTRDLKSSDSLPVRRSTSHCSCRL